MNELSKSVPNPAETQELAIQVPCRLAERVERYANENGNTVSGVFLVVIN